VVSILKKSCADFAQPGRPFENNRTARVYKAPAVLFCLRKRNVSPDLSGLVTNNPSWFCVFAAQKAALFFSETLEETEKPVIFSRPSC
jgi:hypothetical protein